MKNTKKSLLIGLLFFMSHWALYGQSATVVFLEVSGVAGEYERPSNRLNATTPGPGLNTIKIDSYEISKSNSTNPSAGPGAGAGSTDVIGSMILSFHIDKAIIGLSERLFNHTAIPSMNLFIDFPGATLPQREHMRIKMTDVSIMSITQSQDDEGIPNYNMTVRFRKNLTAVTVYNNNVGSTYSYCWNYSENSNTNCPTTF